MEPKVKKIKIEKRYPSQFYIDHHQQADQWLRDNAPDYVLDVIQEMTDFIERNRIKNKENGELADEQISTNEGTS